MTTGQNEPEKTVKNALRLAEGAPLRTSVALIALLGGWASSVRADKKALTFTSFAFLRR